MKDYLSEYKGYCLTCKNYDLGCKSDATTRGFRCTYHGRPMAMDEKCPRYSKDIARSNSYISSNVEWLYRHGYDPRRDKDTFCYITTMCCDILGLSDNHFFLVSLRNLREYLLTFNEGKKVLLDYDVYGVQIAKKLYEEYCFNSENVLNLLKNDILKNYLVPLCNLVSENKFNEGANLYIKMTFKLLARYNIKYIPINEKNIDMENLGHGYSRQRKYSL